MHFEAPVLGSRTIALDVDLVLTGQGVRAGGRPGPHALAAARRAVDEAAEILRPRFIHRTVPVLAWTPGRVELPEVSLDGTAIAGALEGAEAVVAAVCTVGRALDDRLSAVLGIDPLLALAFDGLGSAACERLASEVCADIEDRAEAAGNHVTGPLSPGMIGWPLLDGQHQLFALVDPAPLDVVLTPSGQMIPRKTLSLLVGVGPRVRRQTACPRCESRNRCRYRPDHA